jgi:ribosomal protein S18 acetylase RimI-like enzyme
MMAPSAVRKVDRSETEAVLDTLTLAFVADPILRYWWPRPADYMHWYRRLVMAIGERGFDHDAVSVTANFEAAAVWLPPGVEPDPAAGRVLAGSTPAEKDAIGDQVRVQMERYHPKAPHWYLWMIGVDPAQQGQGFGSALLKHTLSLCDEQGAMAYLESSNPKNVPLYQRHGFEVLGVIEVADVPPMTPMLRPARR